METINEILRKKTKMGTRETVLMYAFNTKWWNKLPDEITNEEEWHNFPWFVSI